MSEIKDWSTTAASNNSAPPDGAPEGMLPSAVNNTMREFMASVRKQHEDAEWINFGDSGTQVSATTFNISGDVTSRYTAKRAIQIVDSSTLYGFIVSSSYSAPNTTVTVQLLTGSLTSSMNGQTVSIGPIKPSNDAIPKNYKYGLHVYAADAGSNDTYVITLSPTPVSYETGMIIHFQANTANTGAATLNVNSIGAKTIKKNYDSDLADNDIKANQIVTVIYDGTNFQMLSPVSNVGSTTTPFTVSATSSSASEIRLEEDTDNGTNYLSLKAPAAVTTTTTFTLMDGDGTNGQFIQTNGSATLSFANASSDWVVINRSTASAASVVTFDVSDTTYRIFRIWGTKFHANTNTTYVEIEVSIDGGSSYKTGASDYAYITQGVKVVTSAETQYLQGDNADDSIRMFPPSSTDNRLTTSTSTMGHFLITIADPTDATKNTGISTRGGHQGDSSSIYFTYSADGFYIGSTDDVTDIRLVPVTGSATLSGEFILEGLKDA